ASGGDDHRRDAFRYDDRDRFPVDAGVDALSPVGFIAAEGLEATAERVADEIARLLADATMVRDRQTGVSRAATPADIAVLFRSRDSHREYEAALDGRNVPAYVYKRLGFFDADEI